MNLFRITLLAAAALACSVAQAQTPPASSKLKVGLMLPATGLAMNTGYPPRRPPVPMRGSGRRRG